MASKDKRGTELVSENALEEAHASSQIVSKFLQHAGEVQTPEDKTAEKKSEKNKNKSESMSTKEGRKKG